MGTEPSDPLAQGWDHAPDGAERTDEDRELSPAPDPTRRARRGLGRLIDAPHVVLRGLRRDRYDGADW